MEVKIIDDFLDLNDFHTACKKLDPKEIDIDWVIHYSTDAHPFPFLAKFLNHDDFFSKYLFDKIKPHLDEEYELSRVYCNSQWYSREGEFHVDNCDLTVLLFLHQYKYGWGGFTEILTEPPSIIQPLTNRLIIFPGMIKHKGYSFAYQGCPTRQSLAFKLNKK